jgi:hypothetical protein
LFYTSPAYREGEAQKLLQFRNQLATVITGKIRVPCNILNGAEDSKILPVTREMTATFMCCMYGRMAFINGIPLRR